MSLALQLHTADYCGPLTTVQYQTTASVHTLIHASHTLNCSSRVCSEQMGDFMHTQTACIWPSDVEGGEGGGGPCTLIHTDSMWMNDTHSLHDNKMVHIHRLYININMEGPCTMYPYTQTLHMTTRKRGRRVQGRGIHRLHKWYTCSTHDIKMVHIH